MLIRRIVRLERKTSVWELNEAGVDGFLIESIEFRQQGFNGINNVINAGAQPSYLIVTTNPLSNKDKKFMVVPADFDMITFVEEEEVKKDNTPELRKV